MNKTTCGITVWDDDSKMPRTCGAPAIYTIIVGGDQIFAACSRHNARIDRALGWLKRGIRSR